nr:unnamed protein product [Spirometra erinaceieuropaei]
MRRVVSSRRLRLFLSGLAAFTAGSLTTGAAFLLYGLPPASDDLQLFKKALCRTAPVESRYPVGGVGDTVDSSFFRPDALPSVFSRDGPLPDAVAYVGLPTAEPVKILPGFLLLYDRRTRIPRWTLEHLTPERFKGDETDLVDRSRFEFFEDQSEKDHLRSSNQDYFRSGFDRGHMAAAGNHKFDSAAMEKSFVLSNIAPQVGVGFNRGVWSDLEKYVRAMARRSANVVVLTGPLFLPSPDRSPANRRQVTYEVIGSNGVAVPTHFFKAVAVQQSPGGPWKTYAWVLPNRELPEGSGACCWSRNLSQPLQVLILFFLQLALCS